MSNGHPSLRHPPLVEMILGVQFDRIRGMTNGHLGAFWKQAFADWPTVEDLSPIEPQWETFDAPGGWGPKALQLKLTQDPQTRLRIRAERGDRLIQVQNGRLHYNWLKKPDNEYPRYGKELLPAFLGAYAKLRSFAFEHLAREVRPDQWEVTYINHLLKGECWEELSDCARLFRSHGALFAGLPGGQLETVSAEWHSIIPPQQGRLHVDLSTGWLDRPGENDVRSVAKKAVVLTLTARGGVVDGQIERGLNLGHQAIVDAFFGLMSDSVLELWGLEHGHG